MIREIAGTAPAARVSAKGECAFQNTDYSEPVARSFVGCREDTFDKLTKTCLNALTLKFEPHGCGEASMPLGISALRAVGNLTCEEHSLSEVIGARVRLWEPVCIGLLREF
jgi:hypothetical protein